MSACQGAAGGEGSIIGFHGHQYIVIYFSVPFANSGDKIAGVRRVTRVTRVRRVTRMTRVTMAMAKATPVTMVIAMALVVAMDMAR